MNNQIPVQVQVRLNNILFKCELDQKFYNVKDVIPYSLTAIQGLVPIQDGRMQIATTTLIICENCYKKEKDNKEGLDLQEPSKIVVAPNGQIPKTPQIHA